MFFKKFKFILILIACFSVISFSSCEIVTNSDGTNGIDGTNGVDGKDGKDGQDGISIIWLGSFASSNEIQNPKELNAYYNTTDGCSYIYHNSEWCLLSKATFTGINWLGEFNSVSEITNPKKLDAYYNITDGCSYIYNGTTWDLLAKAGQNGTDGNGNGDSQQLDFVKVTADEKGILFKGFFPGYSGNNNVSNNMPGYDIKISDIDNKIDMIIFNQYNSNFSYYYPLVDKDKTYHFRISLSYNNLNIINGTYQYQKDITIKATGGLGEYKITNADEIKTELSADRVISRNKEPVFNENPNIKIKKHGVSYYVLAENTDDKRFYWIYGTNYLWNDYLRFLDLKDIQYYQGYVNFNGIDSILRGNKYNITSRSCLEIYGYTNNENIIFRLNDENTITGDWGGTKVKTLVAYGVEIYEDRYCNYNSSNPEEYYTDSGLTTPSFTITGMPGSRHTTDERYNGEKTYEYSELFDLTSILKEPNEIPVITNPSKPGIKYKFNRWNISHSNNIIFPFYLADYILYIEKLQQIDGYDCTDTTIQLIAEFYKYYEVLFKFMINDYYDSDTVYKTIMVESENNFSGVHWSSWFDIALPEDPVRENYTFKGWYTDKDCKNKVPENLTNLSYYSNKEYETNPELILYAGWE